MVPGGGDCHIAPCNSFSEVVVDEVGHRLQLRGVLIVVSMRGDEHHLQSRRFATPRLAVGVDPVQEGNRSALPPPLRLLLAAPLAGPLSCLANRHSTAAPNATNVGHEPTEIRAGGREGQGADLPARCSLDDIQVDEIADRACSQPFPIRNVHACSISVVSRAAIPMHPLQ